MNTNDVEQGIINQDFKDYIKDFIEKKKKLKERILKEESHLLCKYGEIPLKKELAAAKAGVTSDFNDEKKTIQRLGLPVEEQKLRISRLVNEKKLRILQLEDEYKIKKANLKSMHTQPVIDTQSTINVDYDSDEEGVDEGNEEEEEDKNVPEEEKAYNGVFKDFEEKFPKLKFFESSGVDVEKDIENNMPETICDAIKLARIYNELKIRFETIENNNPNQLENALPNQRDKEKRLAQYIKQENPDYERLEIARKEQLKFKSYVKLIKDQLRTDLYYPSDKLLKKRKQWKMQTYRTLANYTSIFFGIIVQGILLLSTLGIYTITKVDNVDFAGIIIVVVADIISFSTKALELNHGNVSHWICDPVGCFHCKLCCESLCCPIPIGSLSCCLSQDEEIFKKKHKKFEDMETNLTNKYSNISHKWGISYYKNIEKRHSSISWSFKLYLISAGLNIYSLIIVNNIVTIFAVLYSMALRLFLTDLVDPQ